MSQPKQPDTAGRLDIAAMRLCERYLLPSIEAKFQIPGLGEQMKPYVEALIADMLPGKSILPTPRRRLCS